MNRTKMTKKIEQIVNELGLHKIELSWAEQGLEFNKDISYKDLSPKVLKAIYNRALTLDYFYNDTDVMALVDATSAKEAHSLIHYYDSPINTNEKAPQRMIIRLVKLMKAYHTNLVQVNEATGDWDKDNDGYTVASRKYLIAYYGKLNPIDDLKQAAEDRQEEYFTDSDQDFRPVEIGDVQNELQSLVTFLSLHANSKELNDVCYRTGMSVKN